METGPFCLIRSGDYWRVYVRSNVQLLSVLPSASLVVFEETEPLPLEPSDANLMLDEVFVVKPPAAILHVDVDEQALVSVVVVQLGELPPASPLVLRVMVTSAGAMQVGSDPA